MIRTEVEIQRVGQMGQGVGYDEGGNIYFVPGAVPGDRVAVECPEGAKKYRDAELVAVVRPSPERAASPCEYFQACGGCDWLHLSYDAQIRAKEEMLSHVLERAGFQPRERLPIVRAKETFGYRNRIQLRRDGNKLGFLRRRSHEIVDVKKCLVAHPDLNDEMERIRREDIPAALQKIELVRNDDGTITRVYDARHGAAGFTQVNTAQNEALCGLVAREVRETKARQALELFCGNGNLTFAYAPLVEHVIAVDANEPALAAARARREATMPEKPSKIAFVTSLIGRALLRKLPPDFKGSYDTLILDPPRAGIGPCLHDFIHPRVKTVIYISCAPITFTKDVQCLKKDFVLERVQGVDMFPHTRHIELVARFSRR